MRIAPRANLTLSLIRQQSLGEDRFLGEGMAAVQASGGDGVERPRDRVDQVHPGPQVRGAELLGYIFDQPGVLYPMPVGPAPTRWPGCRHEESEKMPPPEPVSPNPPARPADVSMGGVLNIFA